MARLLWQGGGSETSRISTPVSRPAAPRPAPPPTCSPLAALKKNCMHRDHSYRTTQCQITQNSFANIPEDFRKMFNVYSDRLLDSEERFLARDGHRFIESWACGVRS